MKLIRIFILLLFFQPFSNAIEIEYPSRAWHLNQNGYVKVIYDIDDNGIVENIRILESKPSFMFDDAVKRDLYKQKFEKHHPKKSVQLTVLFDKDNN